MDLTEIKNKIDLFGNKVGRIQGEFDLIQKEYKNDIQLISRLEEDSLKYQKAVELLTQVQRVTRDEVKNKFEVLVNHALHYICGTDYNFSLEFSTRGNLQEMKFNIQSPDFKEPHDPIESDSGGIIDIVSLALRVVLLEISLPKNQGFIVLDESLKHLSRNFLPQATLFLNELSKKLNRQIILVSHADELINNSQNTIEIK